MSFKNAIWVDSFPEAEDWILSGRRPNTNWVRATTEDGPYMYEFRASLDTMVVRALMKPTDDTGATYLPAGVSHRGEVTADSGPLWLRRVGSRSTFWSIRIWLRYMSLLMCPIMVAAFDPYLCPAIAATLSPVA